MVQGHVYRIISPKLLFWFKIFHIPVNLNETTCSVKVKDTLHEGHSMRSKITYTEFVFTLYLLNCFLKYFLSKTTSRGKVSDSLHQGHSMRSKVTYTQFVSVSAPYFTNPWSNSENIINEQTCRVKCHLQTCLL